MWGDDVATCERAINQLIKDLIEPSWASMNLSRLDGTDPFQITQALQESRTPPLGTGGRVIIIKQSPFCNGCSRELAKTYEEVLLFFTSQPNKFLFSMFIIFVYFYSSLSISEVFEDYIENEKLKNVANKLLYLFAITVPIITLLVLYKLSL